MKKVSAKLFFSVMWRGMCQFARWFFELFGFKGKGTYIICVWRIFATSVAFIVTTIAVVLAWGLCEGVYDKYFREAYCYDPDCYNAEYISENIYYHNQNDGKGYIFNRQTREKTIKNVEWIAKPEKDDSLVCFNDGKKRGYFNRHTGRVVIKPQYDHAWVFSEGQACVDDGGRLKFIDGTGKVVIDTKNAYVPGRDGYMFHGGYCVIYSDDRKICGLMDKSGKMVLPMEYDFISPNSEHNYWHVVKGKEMAVLDWDLNTVVPMTEGAIFLGDEAIDMTMPNNTMRKYDYQGYLIDDFYISDVRMLEYEKDEIVYRDDIVNKDDDITEYLEEFYHPKATARLRAYVAGNGYEGLMTKEGHVVVMPLYKDIVALDQDLYLCEVSDGDKVIVNGKGEIVR